MLLKPASHALSVLSLAILFVSGTVLLPKDACAFKTYPMFGGAIHEEISRAALSYKGVSAESLQEIDNGNTSQDVFDSEPFKDPSHHFDDCKIQESLSYVEKCYADLDKHLSAVSAKEDEWKYVLTKFGELLHPVQDFYSHSNYVELQLKANKALQPKDLPLIDWKKIPSSVRTGFFYYRGRNDNEVAMMNGYLPDPNPNRDRFIPTLKANGNIVKGTDYWNSSAYANVVTFDSRLDYATNTKLSVLHRDLNKDNRETEEGKSLNPTSNKNLFAYAKDLATRETERQWQELENHVRRECPDKANAVIYSLKKGVPPERLVSGNHQISLTSEVQDKDEQFTSPFYTIQGSCPAGSFQGRLSWGLGTPNLIAAIGKPEDPNFRQVSGAYFKDRRTLVLKWYDPAESKHYQLEYTPPPK